jgi:glycosyltransferase involved in cell wall biosynthesis
VVIPAYNEAGVLARVIAEVRRIGHSIVVVDDASTDTTAAVASQAEVHVLRHLVNLGQGAALQTGITFALGQGADIIVTFDADGQHRASDVARLIDALKSRPADFALGSRFLGATANMPRSRQLLLRVATLFTRLTTGLDLTDAHNGLRAMTQHGASRIHLRQNRMAHASEILDQIGASGLPYVEVPVTIEYSAYSLAKGQKLSDSIDILLDLYARKLYR